MFAHFREKEDTILAHLKHTSTRRYSLWFWKPLFFHVFGQTGRTRSIVSLNTVFN